VGADNPIPCLSGREPGWLVYFKLVHPFSMGEFTDMTVARLFLGIIPCSRAGSLPAATKAAKTEWPHHADRLILVSNLYPDLTTTE
jgi:hypothetical protein